MRIQGKHNQRAVIKSRGPGIFLAVTELLLLLSSDFLIDVRQLEVDFLDS